MIMYCLSIFWNIGEQQINFDEETGTRQPVGVNICSPPDPGPARPGMDTTLVILFALKIEIGDCDVCKLQLSI